MASYFDGDQCWNRPLLYGHYHCYQKFRDNVILLYQRYQTQLGYGDFYKDLPYQYSIINFDGLFLIAIIRLKDQVSKIDSYKTITAVVHFLGLKAYATRINWKSHNVIRALRLSIVSIYCAFLHITYTDKA